MEDLNSNSLEAIIKEEANIRTIKRNKEVAQVV
jgi:hypothetical protein